jgi:hypothetical protein
MNTIHKYSPEKRQGELQFINHLPHACGGRIKTDIFLKTTNLEWSDKYYGHIHLCPHNNIQRFKGASSFNLPVETSAMNITGPYI